MSSFEEQMEVENENRIVDSRLKLLKHLNLVTWGKIVGNEHSCWRLLHSFDLVPSQSVSPSCPDCGGSMSVDRKYQNKIGWRWKCNKRGGNRSKQRSCSGSINPIKGTLLEQVSTPYTLILIKSGWVNIGYLTREVHGLYLSRFQPNYDNIVDHIE